MRYLFASLLFAFLAVVHLDALQLFAAETITIEVQETAGIRRFGYPVEVMLELPKPVPNKTHFRLLENGKPVAAQFRSATNTESLNQRRLNFNISLLPGRSKTFTVEYGEDVSAETPKRRGGLTFIETKDNFQISHPPHLHWTISKTLQGLLPSLKVRDDEQMRDDSPGLILHGTDHRKYVIGGEISMSSHVIRKGPIAIDLRFEQTQEIDSLPGVHTTVELQFVNSKSWVRVDWIVDDPNGRVSNLESRLHVNLDKPQGKNRTLVDFGATSYVYVALNEGEHADLITGSQLRNDGPPKSPKHVFWQVRRGKLPHPEPFVSGPNNASTYPEGWAHLMDRQKCLAVAVADFARSSSDQIGISADGTLSLKRRYSGRSAKG
ncbi:MAG: hypothetical protein IID46_03295, partial [Planctomycetes bacterium]|nr:hypothetical protein [Planctomycetota bacterium]